MKTAVRPLEALFAVLFVAILAFAPGKAEAAQLIPDSEISITRLKSLFAAAMLNPEIDEDNDIKIKEEGVVTFVRLDTEREIISYFSMWGLKDSASELERLRLVNRLNDDLIYVRFCMPKPTRLWCDYQVCYSGGITDYTVVNNYREFKKVVYGAALLHDPDNLIE